MYSISYGQTAEEFYKRGNIKSDFQDVEGAMADFSRAIELDSLNPKYYIARGNERIIRYHFSEAINDFTKGIEIDRMCDECYFRRGKTKVEQWDYIGAIVDLNHALEINPENPEFIVFRGCIKSKMTDYQGAISDITAGIMADSLSSNNIYGYFNLAYAKRNLQDYGGAITNYSTILKIDSLTPEAYLERGNTKAEQKKDLEAIDDYNLEIKNYPKSYKSHLNKGLCHMNINEDDSALVDFNHVIDICTEKLSFYPPIDEIDSNGNYRLISHYEDNFLSDAYFNQGKVKYKIKDFIGSISDLNKALEFNPLSANAYYFRGLSKVKSAQKESGCSDLLNAKRFGSKEADEALEIFCK